MEKNGVEEAFSRHRLQGEPIPDDTRIFLHNSEQLSERTGIELNWKKGWAPWLDTSYLTREDRRNPDIIANVRAIAEVCNFIAFIAANAEDECIGYWRGPDLRPITQSPLVVFDNEGQFNVCGSSFAEAVLSQIYDPDQFTKTRDWFRSLGIDVRAECFEELEYPLSDPDPAKLREELYYRYLGKARDA